MPKQSDTSLRDLQTWIDALFEYRSRPLGEDDIVETDKSLEDVEETTKGPVVAKKVPCGKDSGGRPHGRVGISTTARATKWCPSTLERLTVSTPASDTLFADFCAIPYIQWEKRASKGVSRSE